MLIQRYTVADIVHILYSISEQILNSCCRFSNDNGMSTKYGDDLLVPLKWVKIVQAETHSFVLKCFIFTEANTGNEWKCIQDAVSCQLY